jgi:capsular polysaccharide biosynthesis protein
MELDEAVQRVLRHHVKLIAGCLAVGLALGWAVSFRTPRRYSASARIVMDAPDPKSPVEAGALADVARGIATSSALLKSAVAATGVPRDWTRLSSQVSVNSVGTSNVMRITVKDANAQVATTLANALSSAIVQTRQGGSTSIPQQIADLNKRVSDLGTQLTAADKAVDQANQALAGAQNAPDLAARSATAAAARGTRDSIASELQSAQNSLTSLETIVANRPQAQVVDPAITPQHTDPSTLPQDVALGALAGLILGLGLAALREALQPTVVGGRALSHRLGAPVLEELPCCPDHLEAIDTDLLASRVNLAAKGAGVTMVELVGVGSRRLNGLAERLGAVSDTWTREAANWSSQAAASEPLALGNGHSPVAPYGRPSGMSAPSNGGGAAAWVASGAALATSGRSPWVSQPEPASGPARMAPAGQSLAPSLERPPLQVLNPQDPTVLGRLGEHTGLVIVTPSTVSWRDLEPVADLVAISRSPLLGIVTYRRRRAHQGPARPRANRPHGTTSAEVRR